MALPLQGKIAIVTGSSRGIGKVLALRLAQDGADIVVCARSQTQGELPGTIGETATAVEAVGRRALPLRLDLANDADIDAVVDRTIGEFGRIDILVNNAVIVGPRRKFVGGDAEFIDLAYRVNVRGPYRLAERVSEVMAGQGGGTIVNITSGAARHPQTPVVAATAADLDAMDPSYGITKAALDRITTAYAGELKAHNIAIVSISPGLVITERIRQAAIRRNVDFGRAESPEVIASAVATICRDGMQYTGRVLATRDFASTQSREEPSHAQR
ncbi:MAG: SDR family NAD(P)-dependent oxidoreductase [Chloroflexi bacterium]|nr:SDR family NAD(P)-dependent oxidoreductase [Chloroflexota bacterium]